MLCSMVYLLYFSRCLHIVRLEETYVSKRGYMRTGACTCWRYSLYGVSCCRRNICVKELTPDTDNYWNCKRMGSYVLSSQEEHAGQMIYSGRNTSSFDRWYQTLLSAYCTNALQRCDVCPIATCAVFPSAPMRMCHLPPRPRSNSLLNVPRVGY